MVDMERALDSGEVGPAPTPPIDARLIGQIAHELRTPLASLRVAYELLTDPTAIAALAAKPKQRDRLMTNMGRSIERPEQQVTDLLDIGYLQANNLTLKMTAVSPIELIASACEKTSVLSNRRNQFVNIKLGDNVPDIQADHDRLEQVMVYLLSYLMRVTPVGETLTAIAETGSGELHLAIQGGRFHSMNESACLSHFSDFEAKGARSRTVDWVSRSPGHWYSRTVDECGWRVR